MTNEELREVLIGIISMLSITAASSLVAASTKTVSNTWYKAQLKNVEELHDGLMRMLGCDIEIGGSND